MQAMLTVLHYEMDSRGKDIPGVTKDDDQPYTKLLQTGGQSGDSR